MAPPQYSYDLSVKSEVSDELVNVYVMRPVAGRLVGILYHTSITPNHVTVAATCFGILAATLYFHDTATATMFAGLCMTLKDLLDSADGQLARSKQMYSRAGRFLDSIGDFLVNLLVFATLGYVLTVSSGNIGYTVLALLGFIGITLRVSYHVYYQASFLHLQQRYTTNRITEEVQEEDLHTGGIALLLQRIFQALYGWQDRLMVKIDGWCGGRTMVNDEKWFADRLGLRLSGLLGLGTELLLLTLCSLMNQRQLYLFCNLILMNSVLAASIVYRRKVLRKRLTA